MGTYCDCGEKLNDDYADWDREICGYCVLKEKLDIYKKALTHMATDLSCFSSDNRDEVVEKYLLWSTPK